MSYHSNRLMANIPEFSIEEITQQLKGIIENSKINEILIKQNMILVRCGWILCWELLESGKELDDFLDDWFDDLMMDLKPIFNK